MGKGNLQKSQNFWNWWTRQRNATNQQRGIFQVSFVFIVCSLFFCEFFLSRIIYLRIYPFYSFFQDVTGTNGTSFITCCSFDSKERHKFSKSNPACTEITADITFSRILKKINCFSTHNDSTYDLTCFQTKHQQYQNSFSPKKTHIRIFCLNFECFLWNTNFERRHLNKFLWS